MIYCTSVYSNIIRPVENTKLKVGEILIVEIESDKTDKDLLALENTRIANILYVMKLTIEDNKRYLKVFVTPPPQKISVEKTFNLVGFTFEQGNTEKINDYLVTKNTYELSSAKVSRFELIYLVIGGVLFVFLILTGWKYYSKRKNKKAKEKHQALLSQKLYEFVVSAKGRLAHEGIFRNSKQIIELLSVDKSKLEKYNEYIDNIQYKKEWTGAELNQVQEYYNDLIKTVRLKDGV